MTEKELKHLSRAELLDLLLAETDENEKLKQQLEQAQAELADRRIQLEKAGTMAEAALRLNGVFDAVDKAVRQYLENVRRSAEEGTLHDEYDPTTNRRPHCRSNSW